MSSAINSDRLESLTPLAQASHLMIQIGDLLAWLAQEALKASVEKSGMCLAT